MPSPGAVVLKTENSPNGEIEKQIVRVDNNPPEMRFVVTLRVVDRPEEKGQRCSWAFRTEAEGEAKFAEINLRAVS